MSILTCSMGGGFCWECSFLGKRVGMAKEAKKIRGRGNVEK